MMPRLIMKIFYVFGRFWTVLCPLALLVFMFKYAHQLNSILKQIEGMNFRKTLVVLFITFFALWSLIHLSSVFFVRVMGWVWKGKRLSKKEKPNISSQNELDEPFKSNIDYHTDKEQENLFKLDLQGESVDAIADEN